MAQRLPVILNDDERKALLKQANKRYITGHRNKVMMQIMFNLGLTDFQHPETQKFSS